MQNEYDMERNYHEMYGSRKTAFVQTCPICDEGFESHESVYAANPQDDDVTAVCSDHCADIFEGAPPLVAVAQRKIAYPDDEYDECSRCGEEFWMGAYQCPYCGLGQDLPDGTRDHRTAAGMACQWGCGRDPVKAPRDEYGIPPYYDLCEEHREEYNAGGERPGFPNPRNSPMNVNRYSSLQDEPEAALPSTDGNAVVDDEMDPQHYD